MAECAMSSPPQSLEGSFFVRSGTVSPSRPAKLHRAARGRSSPPQPLEGSFFVRWGPVSPPRPAKLPGAARAAAVKTGRRPPPQAARSGLDGGEHDAMLPRVGRTSTPPPLTQLLDGI